MSIIEHVVVFRVKHDAAPSEVDSMVERVNSLVSLEESLHLSMGPITRIRSSPTSSTSDSTPRKTSTPTRCTPPTWQSSRPTRPTSPTPWRLTGSPLRVVLWFKLKEGLGDQVRDDVMRVIKGIQGELKLKQSTIQFTSGENFSPGRAKGFSFASLAVFPSLAELEVADSDGEVGKYHENDKIKEHLDCVLVLDFVVPSPKVE